MTLDALMAWLNTWAHSKQQLHAAIVHLPIAVAVLGVLLIVGLLLSGGKSAGLRWISVLIYLLGAGAAFLAVQSGEASVGELSLPLQEPAQAVLHRHEELAEPLWIGMLVMAALTAMSAAKSTGLRVMVLTLALLGSISLAGWVGYTGHQGGRLVYEFGVGVPSSPHNLQSQPAPQRRSPAPPRQQPVEPQPDGKHETSPRDLPL